jgi:hypothetical protein
LADRRLTTRQACVLVVSVIAAVFAAGIATAAAAKNFTGEYAALGDSYSSGEGVGVFYEQTNYPSGEAGELWEERLEAGEVIAPENVSECHRSPKAYPALVAEALYGHSALEEVFRWQPRSFIFRACSGAIITNMWPANGSFKGEWPEFAEEVLGEAGRNEWVRPPHPGVEWWELGPYQDSWLPENVFSPNKNIGLVTFSIGGNDAGFSHVAANCFETNVTGLNESNELTQPFRCREATIEWTEGKPGKWYKKEAETAEKAEPKRPPPFSPTGHGIASISTKLPVVLSNIHEEAPDAKIGVILYPALLNPKIGATVGTYDLPYYGETEFIVSKIDATNVERFEKALNKAIETTAKSWAKENPGVKLVVVNAEDAFKGHLLGESPTPFANGIIWRKSWKQGSPFPKVESFHPNCLGNRALATYVLKDLLKEKVPSPPPTEWKELSC